MLEKLKQMVEHGMEKRISNDSVSIIEFDDEIVMRFKKDEGNYHGNKHETDKSPGAVEDIQRGYQEVSAEESRRKGPQTVGKIA